MRPVISVENLSKSYQLGRIDTGTFSNDLKIWWAKICGKPNPMLRIGETDHGNRDSQELRALKNVSFTVQQGDIVGIIGRNGAGKSTLLKILSRVTAPSSGKIKVKGRIASLLEVGTGFHPDLTGRENIYLNGAILGMERQETARKFDEIVDFSGVEKFIDTPVKRYSSGMYVRLAFAVAAHLEPEILVVDEVLAVGDAAFQKKCLGKMSDVAEEGRTVLFVSHNMVAIKNLCERGVLLSGGSIVCDDTIDNVISNYLGSVEKSAQQDISTRKDRSGLGLVRLKGVDVFCDGKKTTKLLMGLPVSFSFTFSQISPSLSCIFTIYDQFAQPIATFNNANRGNQDVHDHGLKNQFICEIEKFLLYPGRYRVNVELKINNDVHDHVEGALFFDVEPGRLLDGRYLNHARAKVYLEHKWKYQI